MREKYCDAFRKDVLEAAEQLANEGKYGEAIACLNKGTAYFGNEDVFGAKLKEYGSKLPVGLDSLSIGSGPDLFSTEHHQDIYGNGFTYGLDFYYGMLGGDDEKSVEYVLNQNYRRFEAAILISANRDDFEVNFKVYADELLVFDSGTLTKKSELVKISADVSGVKFLRLVSCRTDGTGHVLISDPWVQK